MASAQERSAQEWVERNFRPRVERSWLRPPSAQAGKSCKITVRLAPTGMVGAVSAACSGGGAEFERSAIAAVKKAQPFPMPPDPAIAARLLGDTVSFQFKPD